MRFATNNVAGNQAFKSCKPHVPDAWIDQGKCDPMEGEIGIIGFETPFNRHFYEFIPPRPVGGSTPISRSAPT